MKKTIQSALIALLTFTLQQTFAQNPLTGTWNASCPVEQTSSSSAKFCALCPTVQKDNSSADIHPFEMVVDKTELRLNRGNEVTAATYAWNEDLHSIEFTVDGIRYNFKVLSGEPKNTFLLKSDSGQLLVLEKK